MSDVPKAREYTQEDVHNNFVRHVRAMIDYWSSQPGKPRDLIPDVPSVFWLPWTAEARRCLVFG